MQAGTRGFSLEVASRRVVVRTGTRTQTVNICTARGVNGEYELTYRLPIADAIASGDEIPVNLTMAQFREFLAGRNGQPEEPEGGRPARQLGPAVDPNDPWLGEAVRAVEDSINAVVEGFIRDPYLHRVEHSFHAELIAHLRDHSSLNEVVRIGASGQRTQLVHKEWPETVPRVDRGKTIERRGLFDVVILAPVQLAGATLEQFRYGWIPAPIVIEIGLDYGTPHLSGDIDKFSNSAVVRPYLVHLSRVGARLRDAEQLASEVETPLRCAYVHHYAGGTAIKRLDDLSVVDRTDHIAP